MMAIESQRGITHIIDRAIVYNDVLSLYTKELNTVILECSFRVQFKAEMAVDVGGVMRDMLSAFFAEAYLHLFDGTCLLYLPCMLLLA